MFDLSPVQFDSETKIFSGPNVPPIYHPNTTLGNVILNNLSKSPSFVIQANYDDGTEFTCKEVKLISIRIAQNLTKFGLNFEDEVGLLVRNSKYVLPVFVGCSVMGFPICPINLMEFESHLGHAMKSVQPKIWFCENDLVEKLENGLKKLGSDGRVVGMGDRIGDHLNIDDFLKETGVEDNFM